MYIHRAQVASVSRPLDSLMNGNMIEAETGEVILRDVDQATFARFCQWVYEGYYDAAVHRDCPKDVASSEQSGMRIARKPCRKPPKFTNHCRSDTYIIHDCSSAVASSSKGNAHQAWSKSSLYSASTCWEPSPARIFSNAKIL